jgi:hypothetical protein
MSQHLTHQDRDRDRDPNRGTAGAARRGDPNHDLRDFAELVGTMRRLQREFFRYKRPEDRPPGLLAQAQAVERLVDQSIKSICDTQGYLFPEDR